VKTVLKFEGFVSHHYFKNLCVKYTQLQISICIIYS
jgi:hypothetical protein